MTTIGKVETFVTYAIGKRVISGGSSGWIELLDSSEVLKTAHSGSLGTGSRRELEIEARIYQHLGRHPRLVQLFRYCPDQGLFMEYMPNGDLKEYHRQHHDEITLKQRFQWACKAAEGLQNSARDCCLIGVPASVSLKSAITCGAWATAFSCRQRR